MTIWLDWYVRWRLQAPESYPEIAEQMRLGATTPLMAFVEQIEDMLAEWSIDRAAFARKVGNPKAAEELGFRMACMEPFLRGFANPEARALRPHGKPLGIVLTRDTAALLADADPPQYDWRNLTFGSALGEAGYNGIYIDIPHSSLLVGRKLQIRAIFALPHTQEGDDGELHWNGGVLVHALVTVAGSERESGAVFAAVRPDDQLTVLALDEDTVLGGIAPEVEDIDEDIDKETRDRIYGRVMEHSVRFLRVALAYHRYGPVGSQQDIGRTPVEHAAARRYKPRKGESLFAMTRLVPTKDRMGRIVPSVSTGWSLTARQEVSGHFRIQPHGPGGSLRRMIWVDSYQRGPKEGPVKPRAVSM